MTTGYRAPERQAVHYAPISPHYQPLARFPLVSARSTSCVRRYALVTAPALAAAALLSKVRRPAIGRRTLSAMPRWLITMLTAALVPLAALGYNVAMDRINAWFARKLPPGRLRDLLLLRHFPGNRHRW